MYTARPARITFFAEHWPESLFFAERSAKKSDSGRPGCLGGMKYLTTFFCRTLEISVKRVNLG